jgi:threonine synthase
MMIFTETRGNDGTKPKETKFTNAMLSPTASFKGLYAPKNLPTIDTQFLIETKDLNYKQLATKLFKLFDFDIDKDVLDEAIARYDSFDDEIVVPLTKIEDDLFVSELYHGPTRAFKDMALQPFGVIFSASAKKQNQNYLVMTATSGDTGPAALKCLENMPNTKVACLYPEGGTSQIQKLQMVSNDAPNLKVIGIDGTFDMAQNALKELLSSESFASSLEKLGYKVSAANSVNFGRIAFQTVYHFWSYLQLVKKGEIRMGDRINLIVPSGNFGNALGGYYAKKMGLPIATIAIASNENNILTELIEDGKYDLKKRKLAKTNSPAMDILISSNIERVLFDKFGSERTRELMDELAIKKCYKLKKEEIKMLKNDFLGVWGDDGYALKAIAIYAKRGYLMDTHTALCLKAYPKLKKSKLKTVMYSTAEWTKFAPSVAKALGKKGSLKSDMECIEFVTMKHKYKLHADIEKLLHFKTEDKPPLKIDALEEEILKFLEA